MHFKILDVGSSVVVAITFVLFALALLVKGFTHGLLLEAGIFLVSVKLIFMSYKSNAMKKSMEAKLDALRDALLKVDECNKSRSIRQSGTPNILPREAGSWSGHGKPRRRVDGRMQAGRKTFVDV